MHAAAARAAILAAMDRHQGPGGGAEHDRRSGLIVALDGPASSGKSSVGAAAAARLGYRFCDTGLLYRALTWLALERGVAEDDPAVLVPLLDEVRLVPDDGGRLAHVTVDDADVTARVRSPAVDARVSAVARVPEVRAALLARQRRIAEPGRIVMAGRDIGTVVLPDADLKIYLDASLAERAARRTAERGAPDGGDEADRILDEIQERDRLDSSRPVAPLRAAPDALVLLTDGNTFEQTVALVVDAITERERRRPERASDPNAQPAESHPAEPHHTSSRETRRAIPQSPIATRITPIIWLGSLIMRFLARSLTRVRIEGDLSAIPAGGPLIVASNHTSNADPVIVGSFLNKQLGRPLNWLGKREIFETPVLGWLAPHGGIHPVDRGHADVEAFRTAIRILEAGHVLAVFPEGTRSPDGQLQEAKDGIALLALRSKAPILPVAVVDADRFWPKGRLLPKPGGSVTVRFGRPFRIDEGGVDGAVVSGAGRTGRRSKSAATRLIMTRIAELLPPRQRGVYADAVRDPAAVAHAEGESDATTEAAVPATDGRPD